MVSRAASRNSAGAGLRMKAGLIDESLASRSRASSSGIRAYIITMPDPNQTMKSGPSTMPSQRWP